MINEGDVYWLTQLFKKKENTMKKVYNTMNDVPIGTEMIVKKYREKCRLIEIHNFPTMFKVEFKDGTTKLCLTHEVEIIGWPKNGD